MEVLQKEISTGYKLTKVGWIPKDWEVLTFKDIAHIDRESLSGKTDPDYTFDYISLSDVNSDDFTLETTRLKFKNAPSRARRKVHKGDVLMSTVRPNLQGFSIIRDNVNDLIASTGFAVLSIRVNYSNEYLYHFLFSSGISRQLHSLLVGSNYPAINSSDVKRLKIGLPDYAEQKTIAQVLSTWDKAIENLTQLIAEKQQKKKTLMQQLLTGKKRFPEFEGEWKEYTYRELLKEVKRPVEWNDNELYHLLSVRRRSGGLFERESLFGHQILTKDLRTAKNGDFLISKMQIVHGASGLVTSEFDGQKISGSYIAVRAKNETVLDINFLNWYSKMPYFYHQTYISSYGVHIEKMTFDFKSFLKLSMKAPSLGEQKKIVNTLEATEKELVTLDEKLKVLNDQKKGLMQQLLTGKKRLKYKDANEV